MEVAPNAGWVIPVSDAVGYVDLDILGYKLKFTGVGYHDHVGIKSSSTI
jgi:hypothetical protein